MDSSKIIGVSQQSSLDLVDVNLNAIEAESLAAIDLLGSYLTTELNADVGEIQAELSKSFRHFLLIEEQDRMPFLQRIVTAHIENMEDERGFPPRHPLHWVKSKLEFSSTGILEFDFQKDAEAFMESALEQIEKEIKARLLAKQTATVSIIDGRIQELQQTLATQLQPVAKARRMIGSEYVNSFIQTDRLNIKILDRFYFVSAGARFNPKQELIYSEVCVRPTGIFDRTKDGNKPSQLKYAISCDRLLDVVNESIARSIEQIQQQSIAYLSGELTEQVRKLFKGLVDT